jgi:hypothetical protein
MLGKRIARACEPISAPMYLIATPDGHDGWHVARIWGFRYLRHKLERESGGTVPTAVGWRQRGEPENNGDPALSNLFEIPACL